MPEKISNCKMASSSKCSCCPYGFHIDRDFVRFCDTLYNSAQLDKLRQHKREKRKEKKSVESYLGIGSILTSNKRKPNNDIVNKNATLPHDFYLHNDGLKDAVSDFEDTWQRSLKKSSSSNDIIGKSNGFHSLGKKPLHIFSAEKKDLPSKSRSSSTSSVSSQSTTSNFNDVSVSDASNSVFSPDHLSTSIIGFSKPSLNLGTGIQKSVLTNIREQMASSLLRLKELEEQVKCIPFLEVELSALKEEKKSLINQLKFSQNNLQKEKHTTKPSNLEIQLERLENEGIMSPTLSRKCLTNNENNLSSPGMASSLNAALSKKSFVGKELFSKINEEKNNTTKSVGTSCSVLTRDIGVSYVPNKLKSVAVGCDTISNTDLCSYKGIKNFEVNLSSESLESDLESFGGSDEQSIQVNKISSSATKLVRCKNYIDSSTSMNIFHSHKSTNTDIPSKYNRTSATFSKSTQTFELKKFSTKGLQTSPCLNDSKKLNFQLKRNVAVGDCDINDTICTSCKTIKRTSVAVGDFDIKVSDCEKCCSRSKTKTIAVGDLDVNDHTCKNCERTRQENSKNSTKTTSVGINTVSDVSSISDLVNSDIQICDKCSATIHSVARGLAANTGDSKIPTTSIKSSPNSKPNNAKLPKLKIPVYKGHKTEEKKDTSISHISKDSTKKDSSLKEEKTILTKEESIQNKEKEKSFGELPSLLPTVPPKRPEISKEIKAACKVLNDCLQKSDKGSEKKALSSLKIIQNEWFRVANQKNADPHLIEDYLDLFEEFSKLLLQRVVNLSDNNGNTALHYAVSYGNFDAVSILIDSKVCDVNKKNKAGYTSIMLVALADMRNDTHQYVVQRLFSIGDINMKASQNGQTALMLAVSHGKKEIAKLLVDAGAEVNLQDKDGSTALMCASEHGHIDIVKLLLSNPECDPTIIDNDNCNALTIAMEAGHKDIGLLIYTNMNFSRGSSPYSTLKSKKRSTPRSTPPPRTPTLRTPPLPSPSARSTNSIPSSFHFST